MDCTQQKTLFWIFARLHEFTYSELSPPSSPDFHQIEKKDTQFTYTDGTDVRLCRVAGCFASAHSELARVVVAVHILFMGFSITSPPLVLQGTIPPQDPHSTISTLPLKFESSLSSWTCPATRRFVCKRTPRGQSTSLKGPVCRSCSGMAR